MSLMGRFRPTQPVLPAVDVRQTHWTARVGNVHVERGPALVLSRYCEVFGR
jgi:hypothetical protein